MLRRRLSSSAAARAPVSSARPTATVAADGATAAEDEEEGMAPEWWCRGGRTPVAVDEVGVAFGAGGPGKGYGRLCWGPQERCGACAKSG